MNRDDKIGGYHRYAQQLSPAWLRGIYGAGFVEARALMAEGAREAAKQAVKAGRVNLAPDDALAEIGADRALPRYPGEDSVAYRKRLAAAWQAYRLAGTKAGLIAALTAAGFPAMTIEESWQYTSAQPAGEWWWYRIVFPLGSYNLRNGTWGSAGGAWGDGRAWDDPGAKDAERVRRVAKQWAPAHARLESIVCVIPGSPPVTLTYPGE